MKLGHKVAEAGSSMAHDGQQASLLGFLFVLKVPPSC